MIEHNGNTYRPLHPEERSRPDYLEVLAARSTIEPPSAISTPFVCERPDGRIIAVLFTQLVFHAEPLAALPGESFSVSAFHQAIEQELISRVLAPGEQLTYYIFVQDRPKALDTAAKNGMISARGLIPHSKTIQSPETIDA